MAACGLALIGAAVHHRQQAAALDAEIDRKVLEQEQAKEFLRGDAVHAGNNPVGGVLGVFATPGGSPEVEARALRRYNHAVRAWQFGGPGTAMAFAGLVWGLVLRRLGRATPSDTRAGRRAMFAVAGGVLMAAAAGLFFLHLHTSSVDWDEAGPALAPWWLAAVVGSGFAVYLARPGGRPVYLLAAVLTVAVTSIGVLYANSTDTIGMFLGFGKSTAGEGWYVGVSAAVVVTTVVFLWLATPRVHGTADKRMFKITKAEAGAAADRPRGTRAGTT